MKGSTGRFFTMAISVIITTTALLDTARAQEKFRIGVVLPFSGIYSPFGEFISAGLKVGVKRINADGGILGRTVELVTRDDASAPGRALLAAKELVSDQKVDALYTGVISGNVLAILPFTTASKVVTVANGSGIDLGDQTKFPYSFQLSDTHIVRTPAVASALKEIGATNVGLIVSTNPPNAALGDSLAQALPEKYKLGVAGLAKFSAADVKDFTPLLQNMKDKGADAIVFDGVGRAGITAVMTGVQTLGWKAKVLFPSAVLSGDLEELVPPQVRNQFYGVNYRSVTRLNTGNSKELEQLISDVKSLGITTTHLGWSAFACDALYLLKWGFETAQKTNGRTDADSVKAAIETMAAKGYPENYSIMYGNIGYSPNDHTTKNADYTNFWSLVGASRLVDGTYEGKPLKLIE